jgi:Tfp pilus assembly protein FimT
MPDRYVDNNAGFTMVELMVGVTLLIIILIPFIGTFSDAARLLGYGRDKSITINLLQQRAEEIKTSGYNNLPAGETSFADYSGSGWTLVQKVSNIDTMPDQTGQTAVKKSNWY